MRKKRNARKGVSCRTGSDLGEDALGGDGRIWLKKRRIGGASLCRKLGTRLVAKIWDLCLSQGKEKDGKDVRREKRSRKMESRTPGNGSDHRREERVDRGTSGSTSPVESMEIVGGGVNWVIKRGKSELLSGV